MADGVAEIQLQPAFKQHQNNGQSPKQVGGPGELRRVHQSEHRTKQNAECHQDDDIRNARQLKHTVGDECQNEQAADQTENQGGRHTGAARASYLEQ